MKSSYAILISFGSAALALPKPAYNSMAASPEQVDNDAAVDLSKPLQGYKGEKSPSDFQLGADLKKFAVPIIAWHRAQSRSIRPLT